MGTKNGVFVFRFLSEHSIGPSLHNHFCNCNKILEAELCIKKVIWLIVLKDERPRTGDLIGSVSSKDTAEIHTRVITW